MRDIFYTHIAPALLQTLTQLQTMLILSLWAIGVGFGLVVGGLAALALVAGVSS